MEAKACHHQNITLEEPLEKPLDPSAYVTGVRHSAFSISNPSIDADVVSSRFLFHFFYASRLTAILFTQSQPANQSTLTTRCLARPTHALRRRPACPRGEPAVEL